MHIAFVSLGAFGHVNPTLALVTERVRRGVRVTYFCTESFRSIVEPSYKATAQEFSEDMKSLGGAAASVQALMAFLQR